MLPLPYTRPDAAGLFILACLVWVVPEMFGMRRQMTKVARKAEYLQDHSSLGILLALQWTGLALNFLFSWSFRAAAITWQRTALFGLGVLCIPLGVGLRWYAIRTLGAYFTRDVAVSEDQPVVQSGPYRFIRHPAYTGTFLTMFGAGLAMTNWASLGSLLVCVFVGHLYRVTVEEKALSGAIGQPYREYMQRTKRFIPWVF